ncbi:isocitrate lyase/phosphoenolpyruvate mutase family protein (plasmid) [Bradyrhizobium japonicum]|nr:isocitrate lyase/phosphoenolpyruvate mutase family protein [Bradyrhizobium japonicum]
MIEAHSGLSAVLASRACLVDKGTEFDGLWVSSLTSSAVQGLPDVEMYLVERRLDLLQEICASSHKPVVVDGDTGGDQTHFKYLVSRLETLGVSAVVIEDKCHPKRNSLAAAPQHLEDPAVFAAKIALGKGVVRSPDFMIFARLESLIAGNTIDDALSRARTYIDAGADGILIHSKATTPEPIFAFADQYRELARHDGSRVPLICVPTTYNSVTAEELFRRGVQIVIHANHLLRASHYAMVRVCESLLMHDRSTEVDNICSPIVTLLDQLGYSEVLSDEVENASTADRIRDHLSLRPPRCV